MAKKKSRFRKNRNQLLAYDILIAVVKFMTVATSGKGGGAHEAIQCETKI